MQEMITANRLADGRVVFLDADGGWSEDFHRGAVVADPQHRLALVEPLQVADFRDAEPLQPRPRDLAHAPQPADAQRREQGLRLTARNDGKASGLIEIGGELREELAVAEADRDRHADLALDPGREPRQRRRRGQAEGALAALYLGAGAA